MLGLCSLQRVCAHFLVLLLHVFALTQLGTGGLSYVFAPAQSAKRATVRLPSFFLRVRRMMVYKYVQSCKSERSSEESLLLTPPSLFTC